MNWFHDAIQCSNEKWKKVKVKNYNDPDKNGPWAVEEDKQLNNKTPWQQYMTFSWTQGASKTLLTMSAGIVYTYLFLQERNKAISFRFSRTTIFDNTAIPKITITRQRLSTNKVISEFIKLWKRVKKISNILTSRLFLYPKDFLPVEAKQSLLQNTSVDNDKRESAEVLWKQSYNFQTLYIVVLDGKLEFWLKVPHTYPWFTWSIITTLLQYYIRR